MLEPQTHDTPQRYSGRLDNAIPASNGDQRCGASADEHGRDRGLSLNDFLFGRHRRQR
jgi:hypothetical protein